MPNAAIKNRIHKKEFTFIRHLKRNSQSIVGADIVGKGSKSNGSTFSISRKFSIFNGNHNTIDVSGWWDGWLVWCTIDIQGMDG